MGAEMKERTERGKKMKKSLSSQSRVQPQFLKR